MWFAVFVESIFWTMALQAFFFLLDLFGKTSISEATFTIFGFIIIYVAVFEWIGSYRYQNKKN